MAKRQKLGYSFVPFPRFVLEHPSFHRLSGNAVKLLCTMLEMYSGRNNGDLAATFKVMRSHGWTSAYTLSNALHELLDAEFLIMTRQGQINRCALFAIAFYDIDEIRGKGVEIAAQVKSSAWMNDRPPRKRRPKPQRKRPEIGASSRPATGSIDDPIRPATGQVIH